MQDLLNNAFFFILLWVCVGGCPLETDYIFPPGFKDQAVLLMFKASTAQLFNVNIIKTNSHVDNNTSTCFVLYPQLHLFQF